MLQQLKANGYCICPETLSVEFVAEMKMMLQQALSEPRQETVTSSNESVRRRDGAVYAARNVLDLCPQISEWVQRPPLATLLTQIFPDDAALVRGLYFDKPSDQNWALPWHKDLLIAVNAESSECEGYSRLRPRAGVLHTEPPLNVLESIVTLRIHLDDVTSLNGPLQVLPGSHKTGKAFQLEDFNPQPILVPAGGLLLMSPLLVHCSHKSDHTVHANRRVLHLEFSSMRTLPGTVHWNWSIPVRKI